MSCKNPHLATAAEMLGTPRQLLVLERNSSNLGESQVHILYIGRAESLLPQPCSQRIYECRACPSAIAAAS